MVMEQEMFSTEQTGDLHAVYIPWKSFLTALETLEQGLPPKLDRSVFRSFSGGVRGQVISGFKFLGLIDSNGTVQPDLRRLLSDDDDRRSVLKDILERRYATVIPLGVTNASIQDLNDAMRDYGVQGGTLDRAIRFFLDAAEFSGLAISAHWQGGRRSTNGVTRQRTRRPTQRKKSTGETNSGGGDDKLTKKPANFREFALASGGTVSIGIDVDLFDLSAPDREFVNGLIDQVRNYSNKPAHQVVPNNPE